MISVKFTSQIFMMSGTTDNTSTKTKEIPKLREPVQSEYYRRNTMTTEEWMDTNEYYLSDLWNSLNNYIDHSNKSGQILDKCTYPLFCDFIAKHTTITSESREY